MKTEKSLAFYLFASPTSELDQSPKNVFYKAKTELLAESLCRLFKREYTNEEGRPTFHFIPATSISTEEQILLDEALDWLPLYRDPDPGLYDPPPSEHTLFLAQYMIRADDWEARLRQRSENPSSSPGHMGTEKEGIQDSNPTGEGDDSNRVCEDRPEISRDFPATDKTPGDSPEERRNSELILLFLLAQAYYTMLERTISMASWCAALDIELNSYYLWIVQCITNLLKESENLKDFPIQFEPLFPDLYPATIRDCDWEDGLAPEVKGFLSTVQQYVHSKGIYEPQKGSAGWIFIELFRPSVNAAIEKAIAYNKKMHQHVQQILGSASPKAEAAKNEQETKGAAPTSGKGGPQVRTSSWKEVAIEVIDKDTIKYKIRDGRWIRANYTEIGFLDKRKNQPNKLWPIFLGLATKNLPRNISKPRIKSKDFDRIRDTLRKFFGIKNLPIEYDRRAKEYRCNFTFNDPRDWTSTM